MASKPDPIATATSREDGRDAVQALVDRAKDSGGDEVLMLGNVGAAPYLRFTPYENNRGVTVNKWSCISISFKAMPEATLLSHPRIIDPTRLDGYNVRMLTTEWVRCQVRKTRAVELYHAEDTPFAADMMRWNDGS